jgi:hypothetical protein
VLVMHNYLCHNVTGERYDTRNNRQRPGNGQNMFKVHSMRKGEEKPEGLLILVRQNDRGWYVPLLPGL